MTKKQSDGIARTFRQQYLYYNTHLNKYPIQQALRELIIEIANEINVTATKFDRNQFLRDCGHPDFQPKEKT